MGIRGIEASFTYDCIRAMIPDELWAEACEQGWSGDFALAWERGYAKGSLEQARRILIKLGTQQFGAPPERVVAVVQAMDDTAQIDSRIMRVLTATSWDETMASPASE